jgi:CubicO group peptidase (beta-lactamase class C family)
MDNLAVNNYFNGAVLVGSKNKIFLNDIYGWSSYQYKIPNGPTTKFRIGSLTKAFTAMAILKLHQQDRRLTIDESIGKIFPEYPS